tara:strand:- start:1080 stop:1856 length:777 start_codon:yes stop_codon:yes gene_type:complete
MYKIKLFIIFLVLLLIFNTIRKNKLNEYFSILDNRIDNIYVLNLDYDKDKMKNVRKNLQKQNIKFIRFSAIDGKKISNDDPLIKKHFSKNIEVKYSNGQKCCTLSHIAMWKDIIKKKTKYNIILEDDVIIPNNLISKLNYFINELPEEWDFLFLGGNRITGYKYSDKLIIPKNNKKIKGNYGTFAYLINSKNLPEILYNCNNISEHIDVHIQRTLGKKFKIFFTNPQLIKHNYDSISNIREKNRNDETERNNKITILD